LIIPKWTAHDVRDWEELLVDLPDGGRDVNAATAAVINYMPVIGITTLTEENAHEAWCRVALFQALQGSIVEDTETGQPLFLTRSDVFRHAGMRTEGDEKTFSEFCGVLDGYGKQEDIVGLPSDVANGGKSLLEYLGIATDG
jgi:hypothetical protein